MRRFAHALACTKKPHLPARPLILLPFANFTALNSTPRPQSPSFLRTVLCSCDAGTAHMPLPVHLPLPRTHRL